MTFDTKALRRDMRKSDAALRMKSYYEWETEVLHDEGTALGVKGAGFNEEHRLTPPKALQRFDDGLQEILRRLDILRAEASSPFERQRPLVAAGTPALELIPNSAFIMMMVDPKNHELEDTRNAIKEEFARFSIRAVRSDEIEHSEEITRVVLERIRQSEFLIADLPTSVPASITKLVTPTPSAKDLSCSRRLVRDFISICRSTIVPTTSTSPTCVASCKAG
jgi:hypothetical protein